MSSKKRKRSQSPRSPKVLGGPDTPGGSATIGGCSAGSTKIRGKIDPLKLRVTTPISGVTNAAPCRRQSALLHCSVRVLVRGVEIRQVGQSAQRKKKILRTKSGSAPAISSQLGETSTCWRVVRRTRTPEDTGALLLACQSM